MSLKNKKCIMHHKNQYIYLATVLCNFKFQVYQRIYWFLKVIKKKNKIV